MWTKNEVKLKAAVSGPYTVTPLLMYVIDDSLAHLSRICSGRPQWLLEAKIDSYKLYDKSMLTLILKNGWVSDDVS